MDYSKLKVTELKELLTARSLPVSGKKEELVARLTEADFTNPTTADDLGDLAPPEEEYDWDTPAAGTPAKTETKTAPATASVATPAKVAQPATTTTTTQGKTPATAPKQPLEAPKPSSDTTAKSPPAPVDTADADAALLAELEKRKKRAERFGIPLADTAKALERAKRFGTTSTVTEDLKKEARGKKFGNQTWKKNGNEKPETKQPATKQAVQKQVATKPPVKKVLDDPAEAEKAKKRAERFGGGNEVKKVKT